MIHFISCIARTIDRFPPTKCLSRLMKKIYREIFIYIVFMAFCLTMLESPGAQSSPPRVTIGIGLGTLGHIPLIVAKEKDYFRQDGIRLELIQIKAGLNVPAMIEGGLDYSGIIGIPINAALQGVKFKVLMVNSSLAMDLVVQPETQSVQELKGKRLAVDSFGVYSHTLADEILRRNGVNPRDVTFMAMGSTPLRLAALQSKSVQATMLGVPHNFLSEESGFTRLVSAREVINLPQTGISTLESRTQTNPDVAYRIVRATLKGLLHYRRNKDSSVKTLAKFLNLRDVRLAERIYDYSLKVFTDEGTIPAAFQQRAIEESKWRTRVVKDVAPAEIFDFQLARRAKMELGWSGWRP
jgi:ABC-type nitrate/sulfonate/bicarbonate transport system substrate-binding protein